MAETDRRVEEAATVRARARAAARALRELIAERDVPEGLKEQAEALFAAMGRTWGELATLNVPSPDGGEDAVEGSRLNVSEGANWGEWFEGSIHQAFTNLADEAFKGGMLTREERISLSNGIGAALDAFVAKVRELAPQLYTRIPGEEPGATTIEPEDGSEGIAAPLQAAVREATKREDGKDFPAGDYAYVPDPEKSSTWKLRLTSTPGGEPDPAIVGAAAAALGPGFRGQKVEIPEEDLGAVKGKVRAAWKKANPEKEEEEMPEGIKEADTAHTDGGEDHRSDTDTRISSPPGCSDEAAAPLQTTMQEVVRLVERAVRNDGVMTMKVIEPGWGSSGFYPAEVLERDAKAFKAGTKMYWNHPTEEEEAERPEGDLRNLAAELVSDARWEGANPNGPGLYAEAKVFSPFKAAVDELAEHIGVSIRASGMAEVGERDGRKGMVVTGIRDARSVDFVTMPGAGGRVVSLFESFRRNPQITQIPPIEESDGEGGGRAQRDVGTTEIMDGTAAPLQAPVREGETLEEEVVRLRGMVLEGEAREAAMEELGRSGLPQAAQARLARDVVKRAPVVEGRLDLVKFKEVIQLAVKEEQVYLAEAAGVGSRASLGLVRGMGAAHTEGTDTRIGRSDGAAAPLQGLEEAFRGMGLDEKRAREAARGRG